jgi:L-threonylcarbamoyladenylate synthase
MRRFDARQLHEEDFAEILSFLSTGGVIGFPTETAYGLGADPFSELAVQRIFQIKRRPEDKPILLLVNSIEMASSLAEIPQSGRLLMTRFWPGALTLILPSKPNVPPFVTAGTRNVALRWSGAPFVKDLLERWENPITATSANLSGMPAAVTVDEVLVQLGDELDVVVDGGTLPTRGGSTILDMTQPTPLLVREGPVALSDLREVLRGMEGKEGNIH